MFVRAFCMCNSYYCVDHGNGTEEILANGDKFFFISIHVGDIYPGTGGDDLPRASNVIDISLKPGDDSAIFRAAFNNQIIPALERYAPDLLLLSSGFDGHKNDPTDDGLRLEEPDYAYITDKLMAVADKYCGGKIVSVLEGGYNLPALRKSAKGNTNVKLNITYIRACDQFTKENCV